MAGGGIGRPSFALGFADLGAGLVDTSAQGSPVAPTFTRATIAWTKRSTGLWAPVASGLARYSYNSATTAVSTTGGYFAEGAATQLVTPLASVRDMTNAAWVKTTMTTAQTSTGIDGVGNSCTRCTATAGNATSIQTLVAAASSRTYSVWIRRVTGTGNIELTQDGATFTNIAGSLNSSTFTRVELNASQLNATFGIRIVTNTDAIDVDFNQFEASTFATSPVDVGSVTRNADVLTYPTNPWLNAATGTIFASGRTLSEVTGTIVSINDATQNEIFSIFRVTGTTLGRFGVGDGGVSQASIDTGALVVGVNFKIAGAYAVNDFAAVSNGGTVGTDAAGTLPTVTTANIGNDNNNTPFFGTISSIAYYPSRLPNQALINMTV